ncbi:MAG: 2-oxoglutarate dehydrogenase, component, dihydrolipoamide succinyltransferase [Ignavibacteria bacterium]|nr:2-oxoglutarate dehydrogenase, component, dihydrolipoamide succinyltransferase [Ignavibacteria bacterium]
MIIDIVMPKLGESLQEGTILKWLKGVGDRVERDEMIMEISTDKVDTEVPSPNSGIIVKILAAENETVEVGKKIAEIETDEAAAVITSQPDTKEEPPSPAPTPAAETPKLQEIKPAVEPAGIVDVVMPKLGESLQEGTIIKWLKKPGDAIGRDEMLLEISTDKVDTEVPSPVEGTIYELLAAENETVEVGKVIAKIATGSTGVVAPTASTAASAPIQSPPSVVQQTEKIEPSAEIPSKSGGRFYSPLVRSIAKENNISLAELEPLKGSGADGRLNKADILTYIENKKQGKTTLPAVPQPTSIAVRPPMEISQTSKSYPVTYGEEDEVIPMDRVRQLIAEHMVYSKQTSAHVTSVGEADVTGMVKLRTKFAPEFLKREGFKLTFTPFFSKSVIDGIKAFPMVNVSVDGKNIVRHKHIHLSVATALEDGNLIVPVVKNADSLGITGLARAISDLAGRARSKKLNPDDIQGGTIALTNVGTFGTLFGTPIINQPQTAIIGVGMITKRPVVRNFNAEDVIVIRDMMYVSITYDHRVIDGMLAGKCLSAIIKSLEGMDESSVIL